MLEVVPSLESSRTVNRSLTQTAMSVALSAPYLLLEVLALSALHISQARPGHEDSYHADATSLQIEALTSFENHLGNINSDNCDAMLMFSSFLGIHSLAEAVMTSKHDADGFLDQFVVYLNLHRGVQTVMSQAGPLLMESNMSPVLQQASARLDLAASQEPQRAAIVADELARLLDDADMSAESNAACRKAVSCLKLIYQADHLDDQSTEPLQHSSALLWAWPALLSDTYTDLLQRRQPEALIILCYFAVLLHRRRSMWCVDCAGRLLIESITKSLGSYWRRWLDWPNEVVEGTSV